MADQIVTYALKGDPSGATTAFQDVGASIGKVEKRTESLEGKMLKLSAATDRVAREGAKMAREQEKAAIGFSKLSGSAQVAIGNLQAMATAKVADMFVGSIKAAYDFSGQVKDLSDALGMSTDDIQVFAAWAEQSGTSLEGIAGAVAKLQMQLAKGDPELRKFGVTALDGKEAFLQVVSAMDKATTHLDRVRIAQAAFGKGWKEIMPALEAGADNLNEIADATSIIDVGTINQLAEMDDLIASLSSNARALAAQLLAAFGPLTNDALEYWSGKLKDFNDWASKESDAEFVKRIGGVSTAAGFYTKIPKSVRPESLSSADLQRIIDYGASTSGFSTDRGLVQYEDPSRWTNLESKLVANQRREKAERDAKAEKDRADAAARLAALDQEIEDKKAKNRKAKAAPEPDLTFDWRAEWLNQQWAAGNRSTPDTDEQAAKDRDRLGWTPSGSEWLNRQWAEGKWSTPDTDEQAAKDRWRLNWVGDFQRGVRRGGILGWGSDEWGRTANQMDAAGLSEVYELNTMSITEMKEALRGAQEATAALAGTTNEQAAAMQEAYREVGLAVSAEFGSAMASTFRQVRAGGESLTSALEDSLGNMLDNLLAKMIQIGAEAAALALFDGVATGGLVGGVKSFFSHADGTYNSPGGIGTLSERGMERVITPQGMDAYVTPGIYAMSAGAQVIPAPQVQSNNTQNFYITIPGSDPRQVVEQMRMIAREEAAKASSSNPRSRFSGY